MNLKKHLFLWGALLGTLSFIGCAKDPITENISPSNSGEIKKELTKIPYANKGILEQFSSNKEIVNYKLSREMALFDLKDFQEELYKDREDLTLSEFPVIVYDNDSNPKYYEFIVLNNGKAVGTITSFAKKEVPGFTAYVFPFVRNYSEENATKYSEAYPNTGVIENGNSNITARKTLSEEELKIREEAKVFWEEIDTSDSETNDSSTAAFVRAWNEEYIIPEFRNDALLRTRWIGACGPAALAWLYRAYYPTYKGTYYPLHGALNDERLQFLTDYYLNVSAYYKEISPLYVDLAEKCRVGYGMDPFKNATLPKDLKTAVYDIFPNHKLEGGFGLSIGEARRSIENNNPVVLLINIWPDYHYVIAFGTKNRYNTYNFGLFKVRKVHTDSWVLVTDNGTTTTKYNNLLPYYMNTHAILGKDFVTYTLTQK